MTSFISGLVVGCVLTVAVGVLFFLCQISKISEQKEDLD